MIKLPAGLVKPAIFTLAGLLTLLVVAVLAAPMLLFAGGGLLYSTQNACSAGGSGGGNQPPPSGAASAIPADYLSLFKSIGAKYRVPWVILAGIAKVESDDGQTTLPGVHNGANAFGAAGPMQIGIGGAAGNTWGGAPVHSASERVDGVATDANGDGVASVYEPADAIAGAAKYLVEHGVIDNPPDAVFAYNHLESYVQSVLGWASTYARGGFTVSPISVDDAPTCIPGVGTASSTAAATAIAFAQAQLGKPYQWGGTGPDAFDCSGLVMMAYRSAGVFIPRTSQQQWIWGPRVPAGDVQPGDLVFFAGGDGTVTAPGHVGMVIGGGLMIESPAPGLVVRITRYTDLGPVGFTRPWAHAGIHVAAGSSA
ncbi:MAG TPA: C40 family peptidase [Streptosporangiaceae bacterium]|nr:C40 family peptidase [Streptosporangiaceae bacterium]